MAVNVSNRLQRMGRAPFTRALDSLLISVLVILVAGGLFLSYSVPAVRRISASYPSVRHEVGSCALP